MIFCSYRYKYSFSILFLIKGKVEMNCELRAVAEYIIYFLYYHLHILLVTCTPLRTYRITSPTLDQ